MRRIRGRPPAGRRHHRLQLLVLSIVIMIAASHTPAGAAAAAARRAPAGFLAAPAGGGGGGGRRCGVRMMASSSASDELLKRLGGPTAVAAPMVQQSGLAFRALARRYGCGLAYTQMFHAAHFADVAVYRQENWDGLDSYGGDPESAFDRPLIAQFAGDEPDVLVRAAARVEHLVDAVDLNLGCPQRIAKRGHYGSFLLEEPALVETLLTSMVKGLSVPVTAKIRVLPTEAATLELVKRIEATGVALLTVHGRTKEQNKIHVGGADWDVIRKVKAAVRIPVIANGGVETYEDYRRCLAETGADAVMSSEGLLENPALFSGPGSTLLLNGEWTPPGAGGRFASREEEAFALAQRQLGFAEEYLELVRQYWPREGVAAVKGHLFKFLYQMLELNENHDLRERMGEKGNRLQQYVDIVAELRETRYADLEVALRSTNGAVVAPTSWYRRHRVGAARHQKTDALLEAPMEERLLSLKERLLRRRAARAREVQGQEQEAVEALA